MNTGLLFSTFPYISGKGLSLGRMTDLDLPALWDILGDEENFRYAPTAALPLSCTVIIRRSASNIPLWKMSTSISTTKSIGVKSSLCMTTR